MPPEDPLTLAFTFRTKSALAALVQGGKVRSQVLIPSGNAAGGPDDDFPRQAIRIVLGLEPDPDEIIFLGKPLLLVERLIALHCSFFPRVPKAFCRSFLKLLTTDFQLDRLAHQAVGDRVVKRCRTAPKAYTDDSRTRRQLKYVSVADALASRFHDAFPEKDLIAVSLTDDYAGPSFAYYVSNQGRLEFKFEERNLPGLGHLFDLYGNLRSSLALRDFVAQGPGGDLVFFENMLTPMGAYLRPGRGGPFDSGALAGELESSNDAFFSKLVMERLGELPRGKDLLFVHDAALPEAFKSDWDEVRFEQVDNEQKVLSACEMTHPIPGHG